MFLKTIYLNLPRRIALRKRRQSLVNFSFDLPLLFSGFIGISQYLKPILIALDVNSASKSRPLARIGQFSMTSRLNALNPVVTSVTLLKRIIVAINAPTMFAMVLSKDMFFGIPFLNLEPITISWSFILSRSFDIYSGGYVPVSYTHLTLPTKA